MEGKYDEVVWTETQFLNFESSIEECEIQGLGDNDGFFKVIIAQDSSPGTPNTEILDKILRNTTKVSRQTLFQSEGDDIYQFKRINASQSATRSFQEESSKLSSYSKSTCCSGKLAADGIESLISDHLFAEVYQSDSVQVNTASRNIHEHKREKELLRKAEKDKKSYEKMKESGVPILPKKERTSYECLDCHGDYATDSYSKCGSSSEKSSDAVYYADGLHCPGYYIGRLHSFFPLHIEDGSLWSLNHQIMGLPKIWVIIPPKARMLLEFHLQHSGVSLGNSSCVNILLHKNVFPNLNWLRKRGIPFKLVVQNAGECIIVLPNAAHFGFNLGWNLNQAINFATKSWIPLGINAPRCNCFFGSSTTPMVHLNLEPIIAAFRPDLLRPYLEKQTIITPQITMMADFMASVVNALSNQGDSNSQDAPCKYNKDDGSQPEEDRSNCDEVPFESNRLDTSQSKQETTPRKEQLLSCPAYYCKRQYHKKHVKRLYMHMKSQHKAILIRSRLMEKIEQQLHELYNL